MNTVDAVGNVLLEVMSFAVILYLVRLIAIPLTIVFAIIALIAHRYGKHTLKIVAITLSLVATVTYLVLSVLVFQSFI